MKLHFEFRYFETASAFFEFHCSFECLVVNDISLVKLLFNFFLIVNVSIFIWCF